LEPFYSIVKKVRTPGPDFLIFLQRMLGFHIA